MALFITATHSPAFHISSTQLASLKSSTADQLRLRALSENCEQSRPHSHLFPPLGITFPPSPPQIIRSFPTTPNDRSVILVQTRRAHYVVSEVVVGGTESKNKNSRVVWSVYMVPERALDPSVIKALGSVQE